MKIQATGHLTHLASTTIHDLNQAALHQMHILSKLFTDVHPLDITRKNWWSYGYGVVYVRKHN